MAIYEDRKKVAVNMVRDSIGYHESRNTYSLLNHMKEQPPNGIINHYINYSRNNFFALTIASVRL